MIWEAESPVTFEAARAEAAARLEADNRKARCPLCKAEDPDPCWSRAQNGSRVLLEICHRARADRRRDRW